MATDELLARRLQTLGGAAPEIDVELRGVIPRARRRRAATRALAVGGTVLLFASAGVGLQAAPWSSNGTPPADGAMSAGPTYDGGPITEQEYLGIVQAVRQCMVERGFSVTDVAKRTDGVTYSFIVDGGGERGSGTAMENRVDCEAQHDLAEAEVAYQDQHVLSGTDRDITFDRFAACMALAGIPDITTSDTARSITDRIGRIIDSAGREAAAPAESCWQIYGSLLYGAQN